MKETHRICRKEREFSLQEESEILKMALEQVNVQVFVYDILQKKIYFFNQVSVLFQTLKNSETTVEEVVVKSQLEPEDAELFRNLFFQIESGENAAQAKIKFKNGSCEAWSHVILHRCLLNSNSSGCAIGTLQDISRRVEAELLYNREKQYRLGMLADSRRVYEINVTKDRFIKLESIQDSTDSGIWEVYTEAMNHLRETYVLKEDWEVFLNISSREKLLKGFEEGQTQFYCEYRTIEESGHITWSSSATHLLKDPLSDDIKGFIYVKNIDAQKKREIELAQQAELDSLTGIYNRRTAQQLISGILANSETTKTYAFMTMDLDDFKFVNDTFGHAVGDWVLKQMAKQIEALLGEEDIFARIGGDEFIAFFNEDENAGRTQRIAELICDAVQNICIAEGNAYRPTVSIGIAMFPEFGTTFEELYENSDQALYEVKKQGKNDMKYYS